MLVILAQILVHRLAREATERIASLVILCPTIPRACSVGDVSSSVNNGCIARVNFPAPALVPHIDSESETFDEVLGLAGESLDRLFASLYYLRPVPEFREQAVAALPSDDAAKLIEFCQTTCAPRVSFETAPPEAS